MTRASSGEHVAGRHQDGDQGPLLALKRLIVGGRMFFGASRISGQRIRQYAYGVPDLSFSASSCLDRRFSPGLKSHALLITP